MNKIIERYKSKGLKLTPQRLAILKYLDGNKEHPTAEDIYREIRKKYPTMSFATVYNTIQALTKIGELSEVTINPARKHFDPETRPHHHIICTKCKRISDIYEDYSHALSLPADVTDEYAVSGNHIDFYGVCRFCQN